MLFETPYEAWLGHMQDLLQAPRRRMQQYALKWEVLQPLSHNYMMGNPSYVEPPLVIRNMVNLAYAGDNWRGCGENLSFTEWNMNKIFPTWLWILNRCNLRELSADPRFTEPRAQSKRDNWSSIFGRMLTRRASHRQSFLDYFLERWEQPHARGLPIFHFDVEGSEYTLEPLVNNPGVFKHERVYNSCIMGMSLKYESKEDCLFVSWLMRSNKWSHTYGDIFGGSMAGVALCRATGIRKLQVGIFMPSTVADNITLMKQILKESQNVEHD